MYEAERGEVTGVKSDTDNVDRKTTWTGKIALPYISDYGYAADFNSCTDNLLQYENCYDYNWTAPILTAGKASFAWTLTPSNTTSDRGWGFISTGMVFDYGVLSRNIGVFPTLHLISGALIDEATTGTSDNPYKLIVE